MQERTSDRVVEQIVDVPVPEIGDQIVEIVKGIPREHLRQHIERFMEGMRRRTFEDYTKLEKLEVQEGADFIGVKWVTECPQMKLIIIDFVSRSLGPLPDGVVDYCSKCVHAGGIKKFMLDRAEASKTQEDVVAEREIRTRQVADVCSMVISMQGVTHAERARSRSASKHLRKRWRQRRCA